MNVAKAPMSEILTTGLMVYFVSNSIQIFSILTLGMALMKPISRLSDINTPFSRFTNPGLNLTIPKLVYMGLNLAILAVCLWKANKMGLVPTWREIHSSPLVPEMIVNVFKGDL